ncbi:MAG TPA: carboxypeptidase-like regulatory domain-containing protein [Planctomycetota bacterium]|jgi:hypothetical protein|nr:carboxypeptidase-like regulatory domain-containing protein [Planctomycetota bacterium]
MKRGPLFVVVAAAGISLAALAWWAASSEAPEAGLLEGSVADGSAAVRTTEELAGARGGGAGRAALSDPAPAVPEASLSPSPSAPALPDATPRAPVGLLLEDERTGEAVGSFSVDLWGPDGTRERLSSDAFGALETATAFPLAPVRVTPRDHPGPRAELGQAVTVTHPGAGGVALVSLALGPTYRLDLVRPPGLGAQALGARLRRPTDALWTSGADKLRPVRPGDPEWVRFMRGDVRSGGVAGTWVLEVASSNGRWAGSAEVEGIVGVYPRPVRIEMSPRALLRGRATLAGEGVSGVSVTLRRVDAGGGVWFDRSFKDGTFELRWLEPGLYSLSAVSQRFDPVVLELRIEAGDGNRIELALEPKAVAGDVSGRLWSRSGSFGRGGKAQGAIQRVELRSSEGMGWRSETPVRWSEGSEGLVGEFTFRDVPRGAYVVTPGPFWYWSWEPPSLAVEPPAAGLEFVLADGAGACDLALSAADDAGGQALSEVTVYLRTGARELSFAGLASGAVFLEGWPEGSECDWTVEHAGHVPLSGVFAAFSEPSGATPCVRTLAVTLESGWGTTFVALGLDALEVETPLAGVEVRLDGELVGLTDDRGELAVRAARRPARASVALDGWRLLGGDLTPTGSFTSHRARVRARLIRLR